MTLTDIWVKCPDFLFQVLNCMEFQEFFVWLEVSKQWKKCLSDCVRKYEEFWNEKFKLECLRHCWLNEKPNLAVGRKEFQLNWNEDICPHLAQNSIYFVTKSIPKTTFSSSIGKCENDEKNTFRIFELNRDLSVMSNNLHLNNADDGTRLCFISNNHLGIHFTFNDTISVFDRMTFRFSSSSSFQNILRIDQEQNEVYILTRKSTAGLFIWYALNHNSGNFQEYLLLPGWCKLCMNTNELQMECFWTKDTLIVHCGHTREIKAIDHRIKMQKWVALKRKSNDEIALTKSEEQSKLIYDLSVNGTTGAFSKILINDGSLSQDVKCFLWQPEIVAKYGRTLRNGFIRTLSTDVDSSPSQDRLYVHAKKPKVLLAMPKCHVVVAVFASFKASNSVHLSEGGSYEWKFCVYDHKDSSGLAQNVFTLDTIRESLDGKQIGPLVYQDGATFMQEKIVSVSRATRVKKISFNVCRFKSLLELISE